MVAAARDLVDHDENCQEWAEEGECKANPDYMLENCEKSCAAVQDAENSNAVDQQSFFDLDALDIDENAFHFSQLR